MSTIKRPKVKDKQMKINIPKNRLKVLKKEISKNFKAKRVAKKNPKKGLRYSSFSPLRKIKISAK